MRSKTFKSVGVVISRKNFSESDRLITIFTKDFGKITLLAKGVRKPESRKRGSLEIFSLIDFQAVHASLDLITEVREVRSFKKIRTNLKKASAAYFVCELLSRLTQDLEPHIDLFYLSWDTLKEIETFPNLKLIRENFIKSAVVLLGFWPKEKQLDYPDKLVEEIAEKKFGSIKVGKILSNA